MRDQPIRNLMSLSPRTIGLGSHIAAAWAVMQQHRIRHLPVVEQGRVVGLISDRDLQLIRALHGVDPEDITVSETMSANPYVIAPDAMLSEVTREMVNRRIGSAVVVEGGEVVGIFTTTDALMAMQDSVAEGAHPPA